MRWLRSRFATLGLSLRLLRGLSVWRSVLIACSAAIATALFLTALTVPGLTQQQSRRSDSLRAVHANEVTLNGEPVRGDFEWLPLHEIDSSSTLQGSFDDLMWGKQQVSVLRLYGSGPIPPGTTHIPKPGEAFVSPAMKQILAVSPILRRQIGATTYIEISPEGLVSPSEYRAYVGASKAEGAAWIEFMLPTSDGNRELAKEATRIVGWGAAGEAFYYNQEPLVRRFSYSVEPLTYLVALVALGIPVLALLGATARLSSGVRERRLAALRLIGVSKLRTNLIAGIESAVTSIVGVVAGIAIFNSVRKASQGWTVAGASWFASDLAPSLAQLLFVAFLVPTVSLVVILLPLFRVNKHPLSTRRLARAKAPSLWRLAPLVLGGVTLFVAGRVDLFDTLGTRVGDYDAQFSIWSKAVAVGAVLCAVGVPLGAPVLVRLIARLIANRSDSAFWLLSGRAGQFDPSGASRIISTLVMVVFFGSAANTFLSLEQQGPYYQAALRQEVTGPAQLWLAGSGSGTVAPIEHRQELLDLPSMRDVVEYRILHARACVTSGVDGCFEVVNTTCESLRSLELIDGECHNGHTYRITYPRGTYFPIGNLAGLQKLEIEVPAELDCSLTDTPECNGATGVIPSSAPLNLGPVPTKSITFLNSQSLNGDFLVTGTIPALQPHLKSLAPNWLYVTDPGAATIAGIELAVVQIDPELVVMRDAMDPIGNDASMRSGVWSLVGIAGALGLLALLVTFVDRTIERRRLTTLQRVTGVSAVRLRQIQWVQLMIPTLIAFPIAGVVGVFATKTTYGLLTARVVTIQWSSMFSTLVLALVAATLVSLLSLTVMASRIGPAQLRRE